ncbi:MAG: BMP family ABC transporter substrate-binding protein, partial [Actinomycetota bacterium]|nr:BMP family ABC transporter substrate-binding protein [Actinomycetota bacterium]
VLFGAGGSTGNGALIEVASEDGAYCVGVDTDQWLTVPEAHPCLLTSAMKLITPGVSGLIEQAHGGTMTGGNSIGGVGLAPYHDFEDVVTDEMRATLEEVLAGLNDGSISTGYPVG